MTAKYELFLNRLVFTEDGQDNLLNAEHYVMLGNYDRDKDRFETMRDIAARYLKSLGLVSDVEDPLVGGILNVPENAHEIMAGGAPEDSNPKGKAQKALLNAWAELLEREGVIDSVVASYEAVPLLAQYSPPINPQQLKNALISREERRRVETLLEEHGKLSPTGFHAAVKKVESCKPAERAKLAARFFTDFTRYHRDLRRMEAVVEAMENVNVLANERFRELSAINNTLYEFLLAEEQKPAEEKVIHHVVLKADIRESIELPSTTVRGARAAAFSDARKNVHAIALEELASRDRELLQELLAGFAAAYAAAKERESALDFEDLQLARARPAARARGDRQPEQLRFRVDHGRRVPGHEPPADASSIDLLAPGAAKELFFVGDEFQSIYGFRHADVAVFRERREAAPTLLPLTRNYRSRPEVLAAVNELFGAEFGDELPAARPRPTATATRSSGRRSSCSSPTRRSYADTGVHWRRAEARHVARRVRELVDAGDATPGEIVLLFAAGHRRRVVRGGAARSSACRRIRADRPPLLRPAAGRRPALLPAAAPEPLRRRGAADRARVAVRRRLERRARPDPCERARSGRSSRASSGRCRAISPSDDRAARARVPAALRAARRALGAAVARAALRADPRRARLRPRRARAARRPPPLREPPQARAPRALVRGAARPRHRGLRPLRRRAGGRRRPRARRRLGGGGRRRGAAAHDPRRQGARVQGRRRRRRRARAGRPAPTRSSASPTAASGSRSPHPGDRLARRHGVATEAREGDARPGGGGGAAAPLLRRDDAGDGPADRLRLGRPRERPRRRGRRSAGCSTGSGCGEELDAATPARRSRSSAGTPVSCCASTASTPRPPRPRLARAEAAVGDEEGQLVLFEGAGEELPAGRAAAARARRRSRRRRSHASRRLSYSAHLALRPLLVPLLRRAGRRDAARALGAARRRRRGRRRLHPTEIGDAVHRLLELVDLDGAGAPAPERSPSSCAAGIRRVGGRAASGSSALVRAYCGSALAAPHRGARRARARSGRSRSSSTACSSTAGSTSSGSRATRALVLDYKTNALGEREPAEIVEEEYATQQLVYALACFRAGADEVEVVYQFLERAGRGRLDASSRARRRGPARGASSRRRSRGSGRASSGRRRARSRARAVRRSTSSAPGPRLGGARSAEPELRRRRSSLPTACGSPRSTTSTATCPALEAVLADDRAARDVDQIVVGGDVVVGPMPAECLERLRGRRARSSAATASATSLAAPTSDVDRWCDERSPTSARARSLGWPLTVELEVDGLGRVVFCHATPRSDEEILTRITPDERVARRSRASSASSSAATRTCSSTAQVAGPPRRQRGQRRASLRGPPRRVLGVARATTSSCGATEYDVERPPAATPGSAASRRLDEILPERCSSRATPDEATATSRAGVARSYVREARRRASGRGASASGRSSSASPRSTPTPRSRCRFAQRRSSCSISVMLSAQTTDVNVNRVTERLFVKYRRPEDYLAVPQEELERDIFATGFYRQKTRSIRGSMRVLLEEFDGAGAAHDPRAAAAARESRGRRRTSSRPSSATRRGSSSTRTSGGSRSGSG